MAPSDATEKKAQYRCTTTIHPVYNGSKKILENLLPVWLLVRTNLFIPSRFGLPIGILTLAVNARLRRAAKVLYRCTYLALNYCSGTFSNPSAIYTKWCAQTFPPIFSIFAIFDRDFSEFVAPPTNQNDNYVVLLKEQSLAKEKRWKPRRNRAINCNAMLVRTMHPSNACTELRTRSVTDRKK